MNANRILYRTRQFWQALGAALTAEDWDLVRSLLTPAQLALFERMQESERAHALRVAHALLEQGEEHPDLLVAALLHDVGKSRFPLKLWERVSIVLGKAFFPRLVERWGAGEQGGKGAGERGEGERGGWGALLGRAFVVAERHAEWGAEMAARAGASRTAVALIRRHQDDLDRPGEDRSSLEEDLLRKLQAVDDDS